MKRSSSLLINESPLIVLPTLACVVGVNGAIVLQQVQYWLQHSKHDRDGRRWIFNTYEDWHSQFPFWTPDAIRKTVRKLEDDGVLISTKAYNRTAFERRKWYAISYEKLDDLLAVYEAAEAPVRNIVRFDPENFPDGTGESSASIRKKSGDRTGRYSGSQPENFPVALQETTQEISSGENAETSAPDAINENSTNKRTNFAVVETGLPADSTWSAILDEVKRSGAVPAHDFANVFRTTRLRSRSPDGALIIAAGTRLARDRLAERYKSALLDAIFAVLGRSVSVTLIQEGDS
jgi:hypothetical protein